MANIVIVSSRCYLLCESINWISIDIQGDTLDDDGDIVFEESLSTRRKNKKTKVSKRKTLSAEKERLNKLNNTFYKISVNFVPVNGGGNQMSRPDVRQVDVLVRGHDKAMSTYHEMVTQIREQLPDQMFLDKLVEKLLSGDA